MRRGDAPLAPALRASATPHAGGGTIADTGVPPASMRRGDKNLTEGPPQRPHLVFLSAAEWGLIFRR
jgi:hypothetical protein